MTFNITKGKGSLDRKTETPNTLAKIIPNIYALDTTVK